MNNAMWLARRHMRDIWPAYFFTAIYFAFMGLILGGDESWGGDFAVPVLMFILIQPILSGRYMNYKRDNEVARHQVFLHSLPIRFSTIVLARMIAMLVAGLINIPVFFLPFWYLGPDWKSFGTFMGWTTFWVGMGLVGAGVSLMQEFWLSIRDWTRINFVGAGAVLIVVLLLVWQAGFRPYMDSVAAAQESPLAMALGGLVIGAIGLWVGFILAVKGFRRREFAT